MTLAAASFSKVRAPEDARAGWRSLAPAAWQQARWAPWLPAGLEAVLAAGLLVPGWVGRAAAIGAAALLAVFTVALELARRRPDPGECGCFGAFSREPITLLSVVRTASLAGVATIAAVAGWRRPGLVPLLATASGRDLASGLLAGGLGALALVLSVLWGQARAGGRPGLSAAVEAVGVGNPIPELEVVSRDGRSVLLADLRDGAGLVLLLAKAACAPCAEILAELPAWQEALGAGARIRVVTSSEPGEFLAEHGDLGEITYFGSLATRQAFGVPGMPAAVLLGVDGHVATPVALGTPQIRALLAGTVDAVHRHSSPST